MLGRQKTQIAAGALVFIIVVFAAYFRCLHRGDLALPEPPPEPAPSGAPALRFIGRFDRGDTAGPRFAWSGSAIRARFRGTQVSMKLDDKGTNAFTVVIDKLPPRKLVSTTQGVQTHLLATGLAAGEHDVLVFKNTEALYGEVQFLGFDFAGGELLPPRDHTRKIEIVGDSISVGMGVDGANAKCAPSPETENAYETYGALATRALGADVTILSASGRGVGRNGDGSTGGTMPVLYKRTLPQYDWSTWDFSAWTP